MDFYIFIMLKWKYFDYLINKQDVGIFASPNSKN